MSDLSPFFLSFCESKEFKESLKSTLLQALDERQPQAEPEPVFYTRHDCRRILHLSLVTIDKHIANGRIKAKKCGNRYLIPKESIDQFVASGK